MKLGLGQITDHIDGDKIEKGNVTANKKHGDDDNQRGIPEFLVALKTTFAVVPRPLHLRQFSAHLANVADDSISHKICGVNGRTKDAEQARRDSNPQQTVLETATLPIELLA